MVRTLITLVSAFVLSGSVFPPVAMAQDEAYMNELAEKMDDVANLAGFFCVNIYPRPSPSECVARIKKGIGASFDPHTQYLTKEEMQEVRMGMSGNFGGIGIEIAKVNAQAPVLVLNAIEGTPAEKAGIQADDLIIAVSLDNGQTYVPTSSFRDVGEFVKIVRGEPGTSVMLKVRRSGVENELNLTVKRDAIKTVQIKGELLKTDDKVYALIQNKTYIRRNRDELKAKFEELAKEARKKYNTSLDGLIISSENNPGGLLDEVLGGVDLFLDAPSLLLVRTNNGIEKLNDFVHTRGDITGGIPILVVVNAGCASACEVFAENMKFHHRALIAGTSQTTFGKGIVQSMIQAKDGSAAKFTSSEYLVGNLDNWVPVQCVGVKPDVVFSYPGVKEPKRISECELGDHVLSKGPMPNAPEQKTLQEVNPSHYRAGLAMLDVYKAHMLPKVLKNEARRKELEKSLQQQE